MTTKKTQQRSRLASQTTMQLGKELNERLKAYAAFDYRRRGRPGYQPRELFLLELLDLYAATYPGVTKHAATLEG